MSKKTGRQPREDLEEEEDTRKRGQAPGRTIESREGQIISLAYDLVEERIRKKTATSQEVTQFIKAGSVQAQLEKQKFIKEIELLTAKTESLKSQKNVEKLYKNAMVAFKSYSGQEVTEEDLEDVKDD